jgi:UDP-N-acetylglucosamine acyltransferase
MTIRVHPTAVVDPSAELGADVVVEAFAIVGPQAVIGQGTTVGPRVIIEGRTTLGNGCAVGAGSVIGTAPQDLKYRGEPTTVRIGDDTVIREYATINRGTSATGATVIGSRVYLMTYVHVAHDCVIADDVILANAVQLAGHVTVEDHAQIGGLTPIHQFVRIGRHAFVGGGSRVPRDVPPFAMTAGNPMRLCGINVEVLRRAGFTADKRLALRRTFRLLFNSHLSRSEALSSVESEYGHLEEVRQVIEFVQDSSRGVLV